MQSSPDALPSEGTLRACQKANSVARSTITAITLEQSLMITFSNGLAWLSKRLKGAGECGLDFNRNFSPPHLQEKWFDAQVSADAIRISCRMWKILMLHQLAEF